MTGNTRPGFSAPEFGLGVPLIFAGVCGMNHGMGVFTLTYSLYFSNKYLKRFFREKRQESNMTY